MKFEEHNIEDNVDVIAKDFKYNIKFFINEATDKLVLN